ncbi:MAG: hypothetical protein HKN56_10685 [Gammaproteobacteria bacterium]|nr:hypothetical protein [Gammaproteobacteria bacterium]
MLDKKLLPVAVFTSVYLLLAAAFAVAGGNKEFVFYIGVMAVLIAAMLVVHKRVNLLTSTLWCLSVWGLMHMAGGLVTVPPAWPLGGESNVLYNLWLVPGLLKFDQFVHAYGFGVATWVCWQGIRAALPVVDGRRVQPTPGLLVLAAAAGMGLGALNEVVEFAAVLLIPDTNVGGYVNTGWDLVANLVGSGLAALLIFAFGRPPGSGEGE